MMRRKFYPAATKYLLQAIEKWDGEDQDLARVYNATGVSYARDVEKGISQFENAVKLQPGYGATLVMPTRSRKIESLLLKHSRKYRFLIY